MSPEMLPELQRALRAAIHAGEYSAALCESILENGIPADLRLDIYRNNTVSNLCNALKDDYPVVIRLVGDDFFRHVARAYIAATPSSSGDINDYGEDFPQFLATFPAAAGLPYLADVARLEQVWKQVFFAAEAEAIDFASLAGLTPESFGELHLQAHPALRILSSPYPVMQIWNANQPDADASEDIDLGQGGEQILLQRVKGKIELALLTPAEHAWLSALMSGCSLAEAVETAFAAEDTIELAPFELAPCLQRHVAQGSFIAFSSGEKK